MVCTIQLGGLAWGSAFEGKVIVGSSSMCSKMAYWMVILIFDHFNPLKEERKRILLLGSWHCRCVWSFWEYEALRTSCSKVFSSWIQTSFILEAVSVNSYPLGCRNAVIQTSSILTGLGVVEVLFLPFLKSTYRFFQRLHPWLID